MDTLDYWNTLRVETEPLSPDKFCKDCLHYRSYHHGMVIAGFSVYHLPPTREGCTSPNLPADPVDGSRDQTPSGVRRCAGKCGPAAKWFERRPPPPPQQATDPTPRKRGLMARIFGD